MSKKHSPQEESRLRQIFPCILAFAIFAIPILVTLIVLPFFGPIYALIGGALAYFIVLAICIVIWWVERPKQKSSKK